MKKVYRISAEHKTTGNEQEFYYSSIKECAYHNPGYKNFKIVGQTQG